MLLNDNYLNNGARKSEIVNYLKSKKENQSISRFLNIVNYLRDSIKSLSFSKGMVITFSGVDGAGKSTVIDIVKLEIEKKIRKRVIVLRHRPSLLPILSSWTKGREKAEKDASNSLPRQGKNFSIINSLFRFAYYYSDYLFGQFYVLFKYTLRGHIVLYDRYYFDFITDSRRSNIRLPKYIIKLAYRALIKPDLNFFLYADPNIILMRKQELDKQTIKYLTKDYLNLFGQLGLSSTGRYLTIKNNELRSTIDTIMNITIAKVA